MFVISTRLNTDHSISTTATIVCLARIHTPDVRTMLQNSCCYDDDDDDDSGRESSKGKVPARASPCPLPTAHSD